MGFGRLCDDIEQKNYHTLNVGRITFQFRLQGSHRPLIHSHRVPPPSPLWHNYGPYIGYIQRAVYSLKVVSSS